MIAQDTANFVLYKQWIKKIILIRTDNLRKSMEADMKRYKKTIRIVAVILLLGLLFIHFIPVSWEAKTKTDYKSELYDKYIGEVVSLYADNHKEFTGVTASSESKYEMFWKGRNLYLKVELDVIDKDNNKNIIIANFKGKRYWTEQYSWKEDK